MASLIHYGYNTPAVPNTDGTGQWEPGKPLIGVMSRSYWSSTLVASSDTDAWFQNFDIGFTDRTSIATPFFIWPVRGRMYP